MLSLHFEQSFYRRLLTSRDPPQWRCLNKDLVVVLSSLHTDRNKRKGAKISIETLNIGLIVICVILQTLMISADDFLQTCLYQGMFNSTIILMRKCDCKYREMFSTELLSSEPKNITNPCLPRVASRRLVYLSLRY